MHPGKKKILRVELLTQWYYDFIKNLAEYLPR